MGQWRQPANLCAIWPGHLCPDRDTPQCFILFISLRLPDLCDWCDDESSDQSCSTTVLLCPVHLSMPKLPATCPGRDQINALWLHHHADRQARNLVATRECVCGRNPDAYWHRNSLWSPFSSSLKGGFGLQAAVCSLVIVPPEPWAGFAPHPTEGFLANKQGSKEGELQRVELEHLHTQKFCMALGAHQNHPWVNPGTPLRWDGLTSPCSLLFLSDRNGQQKD